MCGMRPAVIVMETLRRLDRLHLLPEVGYTTSAAAERRHPARGGLCRAAAGISRHFFVFVGGCDRSTPASSGALDKGTPEILKPVVGGLLLGPQERALEQGRRQDALIDQSRGPGDECLLFGRGRTQDGLELGDLVGIEDRRGGLRRRRPPWRPARSADPTIVNTDSTTKKTEGFSPHLTALPSLPDVFPFRSAGHWL